MPVIVTNTLINSTQEICFDLSRSVELHIISTNHTQEKAVEGITSGLMEINDTVTWEAKHLGVRQRLKSKITQMNRPFNFRDEQVTGAFSYIIHDHTFELQNGMVIMKDRFEFASPFGIIGRLFDKIFLKRYLTHFLIERNKVIKEFAETSKWKSLINS